MTLQHVRRRRLLLQGFGEFRRARLYLVKQAHILDGDDGLVGEGFDQFDSAGR